MGFIMSNNRKVIAAPCILVIIVISSLAWYLVGYSSILNDQEDEENDISSAPRESYSNIELSSTELEESDISAAFEVEECSDNVEESYTIIQIEEGDDKVEENYNSIQVEKTAALFDELEQQLQNSVERAGGRIGISFKCLTTHRQISIGGDQLFFGASTVKLPTHMIIAEMIDDGLLTWDYQVTYTENYFLAGTGSLQFSVQEGDSFSVAELLRLSIMESDNIAHWMLVDLFTPTAVNLTTSTMTERISMIFERYLAGETTDGTNHFSPDHLVTILSILYEGRTEIAGYERTFQYMQETFKYRLYTSYTSGFVAHTTGTMDPYFHDVGIFFGDSPYILAVMTHQVEGAVNYISTVSDLVWSFYADFATHE